MMMKKEPVACKVSADSAGAGPKNKKLFGDFKKYLDTREIKTMKTDKTKGELS